MGTYNCASEALQNAVVLLSPASLSKVWVGQLNLLFDGSLIEAYASTAFCMNELIMARHRWRNGAVDMRVEGHEEFCM